MNFSFAINYALGGLDVGGYHIANIAVQPLNIVPFADFNCLELPKDGEHENDFAMLADIFPTGYHGVAMTNLRPGETITI